VLSFTQSRVPFGMELQRYGTAQIDGTRLFPVPQLVNDAGESLGTTQVLTEHFAISEYVDLPEDDRLSRPGFQPLPAGVATSSGGYLVPTQLLQEAGLQYEVVFRDEPTIRTESMLPFDAATLSRFAAGEASGRSEARWRDKVAERIAPVVAKPSPDWVAADAEKLTVPTEAVSAPQWAAQSPAFLSALQAQATTRTLVVEEFEIE
jgi:hypothetical protein